MVALCLNVNGLQRVLQSRMIECYIPIFTNKKWVRILNGLLSCKRQVILVQSHAGRFNLLHGQKCTISPMSMSSNYYPLPCIPQEISSLKPHLFT